MKPLTIKAKNNNLKYLQFRDKLAELKIISKDRKRYVPTRDALKEGIASESGRFGNEMVLSISYHYDEEKVMDRYLNDIKLIVDGPKPF